MTQEFTTKGGYRVDDLIHFGFDHLKTGLHMLKNENPETYDSAGYIINLGFELILKAWHLHEFESFKSTHLLKNLTDKLRNQKSYFKLSQNDEVNLKKIESWYQLRYPRRKEGPIPIGSQDTDIVESLIESLWKQFPQQLVDAYNSIDPTQKGGRILMKKRKTEV